jgi:hypothetical protein
MESLERDFKGVWIKKEIWLNTNLSLIEKVLIVEIDSLDKSNRGCFASNEYLAKFVQLSEGRVANIISDLKKRDFLIQLFFDGRNRGLRINKHKCESSFNENVKPDLTKTGKRTSRKREYTNTDNNTINNTINILSENPSEFSHFQKITIDDSQSSKVNPFTIVANLQSEKERKIVAPQKERKADAEPKPERKPNPTYEAFTVFCQTFEQLSGAAYPTDQKGHYIMSPKDAGGMVYLLRWLKQVDRNNDTNEALKVFLQAAWSLPDKWLKANFTPPILYGQANKVYTAYQTSSPAAKKKAYDDEADRLLNEYIQTLKQTQ